MNDYVTPELLSVLSAPTEPTLEQQREKWRKEIAQWSKTACPRCGGTATRKICRCPKQHAITLCGSGCRLPHPHRGLLARVRTWLKFL
jgi:hypothetical protein